MLLNESVSELNFKLQRGIWQHIFSAKVDEN